MSSPLILVLVPALLGALAFMMPAGTARRALLPAGAVLHFALSVKWILAQSLLPADAWLGLDQAGKLFLGITTCLFLAISLYSFAWLRQHPGPHAASDAGWGLHASADAVFVGCMLLFLSTMTLAIMSLHFGLLWVAIEATTLASAPLIYYHRTRHALEALWKYLLICSVGIALALLGNFLLAAAANYAGTETDLSLPLLLKQAALLNPAWLKAALILLFVGFGTKMGLAPMHTWLPDAHSEAPSPVSALLSGALLNCAFLGLLRAQQVAAAAGAAAFGQSLFLLLGVLSVTAACVFIWRQRDYKRLLAYSSVENMGLIALGVGLGGLGGIGALMQAMYHSLCKAALFLLAGNFLLCFGSTSVEDIAGARTRCPRTAGLWLMGFFVITGAPPFGIFFSKLMILKALADLHHWWLLGFLLLLLTLIFASMSAIVIRMVFQPAHGTPATDEPGERFVLFAVPAVLLSGTLLLGLHVPLRLQLAISAIAAGLGGAP